MSHNFAAIADAFASTGIAHAFGVTGSGASLSLITALQDRGVGYYPVVHESAAALMAGATCHDGATRGLAVTIKGPGFANLLPGQLANAYEGRPAISVSEAYAASANPWQAHKRLDHDAVGGSIFKATATLDDRGARIDPLAAHARAEMPGPVHVDLTPAPDTVLEATRVGDIVELPAGSEALDAALVLIVKSARPLVVLGSWALRRLGHLPWSRLRVPLVTTAAAKGAIDEHGDFAAGVITGEAGELSPEANLFTGADLVVAFGLRNREVVKAAPYPCPLVAVDALPMADPGGFQPALECVAPDADGLAALFAALQAHDWGRDEVAQWRGRVEDHVLADETQLGHALRRAEETLAARDLFPRLVLDTGFFCTVGETAWRCRTPGDYVGSAVGRFMGVSIPTAIGLAICDRERPVLCVAGDGGIGGAIAELALAVTENLPLVVICASDGGYGSVAAFASDTPAVIRATASGDRSWWKVADALGCAAAAPGDVNALARELDNWQPAGGPLFLQVRFDSEAYRRIPRALRG